VPHTADARSKPNKLCIILWSILVSALPLGRLSTLLVVCPYLGSLLPSILQGS
jgi:hypothetical protein